VPEVGDASDKWGPYNQGHFCLFRINFTLLAPLHRIGASGSFDFEKEGQTCKVKKKRGKRGIRSQNRGSVVIDPFLNLLHSRTTRCIGMNATHITFYSI
jgi:hypothetical protein